MSDTTEWLDSVRIADIGTGYLGLPLAVEFGNNFPVIGFDIKKERIAKPIGGLVYALKHLLPPETVNRRF